MNTVMNGSTQKPQVLCISGHDPSGGAGIQADIEACAALGAHALSVLSSITVQDSREVYAVRALDEDWLVQQVQHLLADCRPGAIKVGLVGSAAQARRIAGYLRETGLPSVVDPVLRAGGGGVLAGDDTAEALRAHLLPAASVITPNAREARALTGLDDADAAAEALLQAGCANVLVTGGDEPGDTVVNSWHRRSAAAVRFEWPRVPLGFHGAGCTLAASIAACLAAGLDLATALSEAQAAVHLALRHAVAIGRGRAIPGRIRSGPAGPGESRDAIR